MATLLCRHCHAFKLSRAPGQSREQVRTGSTLKRHQVDRRVLASSINFDVEFKPIALVQATQARPLNRTDMHECIGLTVITRNEAEALHRIEELDGSVRTFAGQLALRCSIPLFNRDDITHNLKVAGRNLAAAIHQGEFKLLTFSQTFQPGTFDCADVNEHVLTAIFALDKAEALAAVEELNDALALANDLRRHPASTTAAAARAAEAATTAAAATGTTATKAATITTAEAAARSTAAEPISAAAKAVTTAHEWIETVLAETVPLVPAPAATSSVEPHKLVITFTSPYRKPSKMRTRHA